jgi:CheY-like chemotaxis protein
VPFAEAALARAELVLPALSGARVLWVDGTPSNNRLEEGVLQDMGMKVHRALTTPEALYLAERVDFDLIISNMFRSGDTSTPLARCGAAYFGFPDDKVRNQYGDDLNRFNANIQMNPPAGFAMAEAFAQKFPERFGITQAPRIIFYTLASGGISASACGRIVTNRADVLLQSVVSALEELRWETLVPSKKTRNTADAQ